MAKSIAILATLDTKGAEAAFLKEMFAQRGLSPLLLDLGLREEPAVPPDISREAVAEAAEATVGGLLASSREEAMARMGTGAGILLRQRYEQGRLHGVIGLGGNQGTAMACLAMQALPLGLPKVMVSTVASGNIRPYIGAKDIAMVFAVADLFGGPNPISRSVLTQAAGALSGMVLWGEELGVSSKPLLVAITALGNTHPAVARCHELLAARGWCGVAFHASGACGTAMEELIAARKIDAVLDITPHELVGEILGYDIYTPVRPGRLTAAGRRGIPQVVSTGGLEYYCFGPKETMPPEVQDRVIYMHNPANANVMLTTAEMSRLGRAMAERLNESTGPVSLMLPLKGWSEYGREDGPLWNPKGRAAFAASLKASLRPNVELVELDLHINDPPFAETCVERLGTWLKEQKTRQG